MTARRPFTLIAAMLFAIMAAVHVYRLVTDFQIIVGTYSIPISVSWVATALLALLAIMLFREAKS
ncbi:MAG: hypothetical protein ABIS39_04855 [Sphingomicrobium sp.]